MKKGLLIFFVSIISCSPQIATRYEDGNNQLARYIATNVTYPDEAIAKGLSALVLVKISFKKNGEIDSIITINSTKSLFSKTVKEALEKTKDNWNESRKRIPVVIPIYFIHGDIDTTVTIDYFKDFRPDNALPFPVKCIFFNPIMITSKSNVRTY